MSLVSFNVEGRRIFGSLHLPKNGAACVVCLHGLEGSKDSPKWLEFASRLADEGFACLRFSFRGCGEGAEKSEGEFEDISLTARIKDFRAALAFLAESGRVNMDRVGAVGSSFGGMVAIAAQDPRVKAIVTLASPYKIPRYDRPLIPRLEGNRYVLPSGRRFKIGFYEDLKKYNLLQDIRSAPPILIVQGDADEIVPMEHAQLLYNEASEPKRLEVIKGANHIFSQPKHLEKVINEALNWFKTYL